MESSTGKVAAGAVIANPLAGREAQADLSELVELAVAVGAVLTQRALDAAEAAGVLRA